jgi:nitrate/nitrite transport system substrate-binding protein
MMSSEQTRTPGLLPLERTRLSIRYIPILCALPLLYAHHQRLFEKEGLSVDLSPAPGWSAIKELLVHGKIDAAHMLAPMPLACTAGIDGMPAELRICLVQNVNGQALVLSQRHRERVGPGSLRGLTFGVPYQFSMQFYLLCHYLTQHDVHPLKDIRIIEVAPPQMPQYLADGTIDGFLGPEPYVQLAVSRKAGFIVVLSKQIWPGHPCCSLATSADLLLQAPRTVQALQRSVLAAQRILHEGDAKRREELVMTLAEQYFSHIPEKAALTRALTGSFPDGRGQSLHAPDHIDYLPHPQPEVGAWILSQMQRWGQLSLDVDRAAIARRVMLTDSVSELAPAFGFAQAQSVSLPTDPGSEVKTLPFSEPQPQAGVLRSTYDMEEPLRVRMRQILEQLSEATVLSTDTQLDITSRDEVGWLEQMINEVIRNAGFSRQAMREKIQLEEESRLQQQLLSAEKELVRQLSIPVIPLIPQVLLFPLIGNVNTERLQHLVETILHETSRRRAQIILLDLTGIGELDEQGVAGLRRGMAAVRLLGARYILVGINAALSTRMVAMGVTVEELVVKRDVASALEYALHQLGVVLGK